MATERYKLGTAKRSPDPKENLHFLHRSLVADISEVIMDVLRPDTLFDPNSNDMSLSPVSRICLLNRRSFEHLTMFLIAAVLMNTTDVTFRVSATTFIDISHNVFARYSFKFERERDTAPQIDLRRSWIDEHSVTQWVKACQGENYEITDADPIATHELCDEQETERAAVGIQAKIRAFLGNGQIEADLRLQLRRAYQNWERKRERDCIAQQEIAALWGEVAELCRQFDALRNESQGRLVIAPRSDCDPGGIIFYLRLHKCGGESAQDSQVLFNTTCNLQQRPFVVANLEVNTAGSFITDDRPNRFFVLHLLHNLEVTSTHYMLRTRHDSNQPRSWRLDH